MAIDNKIRDEKFQDEIKRETTKLLTLSSGKIDKYEYLTGEEILPSDQRRVLSFSKSFKEKTKAIEDQGKKQIKEIEDHGK